MRAWSWRRLRQSEDVYLAAPELTHVWQAARRDDGDCGVQVDCSEGFGKVAEENAGFCLGS